MRTLRGLRRDQFGPDRSATVDERAAIARLVIGGAVLPAPPDDAEPLEGQGSHRGVMPLPPPALQRVVAARPPRIPDGVVGELVDRLGHEGGRRPAPMHRAPPPPAL